MFIVCGTPGAISPPSAYYLLRSIILYLGVGTATAAGKRCWALCLWGDVGTFSGFYGFYEGGYEIYEIPGYVG